MPLYGNIGSAILILLFINPQNIRFTRLGVDDWGAGSAVVVIFTVSQPAIWIKMNDTRMNWRLRWRPLVRIGLRYNAGAGIKRVFSRDYRGYVAGDLRGLRCGADELDYFPDKEGEVFILFGKCFGGKRVLVYFHFLEQCIYLVI